MKIYVRTYCSSQTVNGRFLGANDSASASLVALRFRADVVAIELGWRSFLPARFRS
ncbi:MAG: hypothetical protein ACI9TF_001837, partial [Paracrocinitomix sp.]